MNPGVAASRDDERSLIEAAQADPRRFLELYDRHVDRVYAYVSRRVRSRAAAEDITSAVFEQALANLLSFEFRGAPFVAWLFRIAANALTDHWRREGPRPLMTSGCSPSTIRLSGGRS
jgi:RNA polymerase sigma-70 factor (ECF subfamily)